jgi:DNA polymerase-4
LPQQAEAFVAALPIEKFHGIGQVTARKMHALGIDTGADLRLWAEADLVRHFGKAGRFYYRVAHGQDDRPVNPNRIRKSLGAERSFSPDLVTLDDMTAALDRIAAEVVRRLGEQNRRGHTLTLKIKYANYRQITRSRTFVAAIGAESPLGAWAEEMLMVHCDCQQPVRLLGLSLSNLEPVGDPEYMQLSLEV